MARASSIEPTGLKRREDRIMESCFDHSSDIWYYVGAHCSTEEIIGYLPIAIKADNAVFAGYLLQQLANSEEPEVFVEGLLKVVGKEITIGSGLDSVVRSVLAMNCERLGLGPVLSNYENCQRFPMKAKDLLKGTKFAECERFVSQHGKVEHDGRLDEFLESFSLTDIAPIVIGYRRGDELIGYFDVSIRNGQLLPEDAKRVLRLLDDAGVKDALPAFDMPCNARYCLWGSSWLDWDDLDEESDGAKSDGAILCIECLRRYNY